MCVAAAAALPALGTIGQVASIAGTAFSAINSIRQSRAQERAVEAQNLANAQAAEYNAKVADNNRILAERMAEDEIEVGREEERAHRMRVAALVGNTRAVLAGSGFDATAGDAPVLVGDTVETGQIEALNIRRNAENRAAAKRFQGANFGAEAAQLRQRSQAFSVSTPRSSGALQIAAGVGAVADKWNKYNPTTTAAPTPTPDLNNIWT